MRILVADDSPGIGTILMRYFAREGHVCEHVATGAAALRRLAGEPRPDVLILDLRLGDMSGAEVIARLRADASLHTLPVVLVTGYAAADGDLPPEGSYQALVPKPFDLQEIGAALAAAVGAGREPA